MPDYGEIFCEAVEEVIRNELRGLNFDLTRVCQVDNIDERSKGIYWVSTDSAKFKAYSSNTTYEVGDTVYVVIPNNDNTQQKIITAKKVTDTPQDITYVMPFTGLTDITGNLIKSSKEISRLANSVLKYDDVPIWTYNKLEAGYSHLGIKASFRSSVKDAIKGSYGLRIDLIINNNNEERKMASYYLDSKDMYGNPYSYNGYFEQQKVFDISDIPAFNMIKIYFYQSADFRNANEELIAHSDPFGNSLNPNLFVNNLYLCLGYDTDEVQTEGLLLYTGDETLYGDSPEKVKIQWRFIHQLKNKKIQLITEADDLPEDYEIVLYKYNKEASRDILAGQGWVPIKDEQNNILTNFNSYIFTPDSAKEGDKFKAIIKYDNRVLYESNILEFINKIDLVGAKINRLINNFQINCLDKSNGIYNLYGSGDVVLNPKDATKTRKLVPVFLNNDNIEVINEVDQVKWIVPAKNTMINLKVDQEDLVKIEGMEINNVEDYILEYIKREQELGENIKNYYLYKDYYYIFFFNPKKDSDQQIKYTINKDLISSYSNNTITCQVTQGNLKPITKKDFSFSYAVTGDYKVVLEIEDEEKEFILSEEGKEEVKKINLKFFNPQGEEIPIDGDVNEIKWTWWKESTENTPSPYNHIFQMEVPNGTRNKNIKISLSDYGKTLNEIDVCYDTICAEVTYKSFKFYGYLPLTIKDEIIETLQGGTEIVYTETGELNYSKENFNLIFKDLFNGKYTEEQIKELTNTFRFEVRSTYDRYKNNTFEEDIFKPVIDVLNQLCPVETNAENLNASYCIKAYMTQNGTEKCVWSQPLMALINNSQNLSNNTKESGRSLDLNIKNPDPGKESQKNQINVISSTISYGEPTDVEGNQGYTGIVLGKVSQQDETKDQAQFGLYGIQNNDITFAIRQKGDAYFKGTVKAGSGNIGGWNITSEGLVYEVEGISVGIIPKTIKLDDGTVIPGIQLGNALLTPGADNVIQITGTDINKSLVSVIETNDAQNKTLWNLEDEIDRVDKAINKLNEEIFTENNFNPKWASIRYLKSYTTETAKVKSIDDKEIEVIVKINPEYETINVLTYEQKE